MSVIKFFHYESNGKDYWVPEVNGQRMSALLGDDGVNPPSNLPDFGTDASAEEILVHPFFEAPREIIVTDGDEKVLEISPPGAPSACIGVLRDGKWLLPVCLGSATQTAAEEARAVVREARPGDEVAEFKEPWEFAAGLRIP